MNGQNKYAIVETGMGFGQQWYMKLEIFRNLTFEVPFSIWGASKLELYRKAHAFIRSYTNYYGIKRVKSLFLYQGNEV